MKGSNRYEVLGRHGDLYRVSPLRPKTEPAVPRVRSRRDATNPEREVVLSDLKGVYYLSFR